MTVNYLETHSTDPAFNLAFEEYVLENKGEGDWLILWQNDNTIVVGLNQNTAEEINRDFVEKHHVHVVRRRTGGGAVYHDLGNLNYSFISDLGNAETLTISRFTEPVCRALESMGVHAETSGRNDIVVNGCKVSGVAQRIYKNRILHHGTLLYDSNSEMVAGALHVDPDKFQSKSAKSVQSRIGNIRSFLPQDMSLEDFWKKLLAELAQDGFTEQFLTAGELHQIEKTAEDRYRSWDWVYGKSPEFDYHQKRRYPGGTLEVYLRITDGIIRNVRFVGDFMALESMEPAVRALRGSRFRK